MIASAPSVTKALWMALLLTVCLQMNAFAANADQSEQQQDQKKRDITTGNGATSNPFGGTFGGFSGFFNPSAISSAASGISSSATSAASVGRTSLNSMADQYLQQYPEAKFLRDDDIRDANNNAIPGLVNPALIPGASPFGTLFPPTPSAAMSFPVKSRLEQAMITAGLTQIGGYSGQQPSDLKNYLGNVVAGSLMTRSLQYPVNAANQARAQAVGQSQAMTNAMGDMSKAQAASAIGYCSSYLQNFTTDDGNRWNKIRNGLFVPIAILLLLPGAVLTQVRAMVVAGNPVLSDPTKGEINPLEGLLRAVVAIFLIPATYLVVNYGIDFSNSIVDSIAQTYQTIMGSNMYQDALGTEVNAFNVRTPKQNQNAGAVREWPQQPITGIPSLENALFRTLDPVTGQPIPGKTDEAMPAAAVAARQLSFGANAGLTAAWNILCAFQMAYLGYLFFVGPIAAALWVWPMSNLRAAFPNWVEGVITLCFWSLFWNTAILLMACFKGSQESSTVITTALNFLATASVKYAFDFANLVKAAGQQAGSKAMEGANGGKGGGAGGKGSQGKAGANAGQSNAAAAQAGANQPGGAMPGTTEQDTIAQPAALTAAPQPFAPNGPSPGLTPSEPIQTVTAAAYHTMPQPEPQEMPPLAVAPNSVRTENMSLGESGFTVSRSLNEEGQPVDDLRAPNGEIIAHDISDTATASFQNQEYDLARINTGNGTQYTLTNHENPSQTFTAMMPPSDRLQSAANLGGTLSGTGNLAEDSIALRSGSGTLLLEDGGNTVLIPQGDNQNSYDMLTVQPGAAPGTFTGGGQTVSLSQNQNGDRVVSLHGQNGSAESFTVRMTGDGAYTVAHAVNGQLADNTYVSTDGQSTYYAKYDAAGQLTDMDQITGNQINSTLYGDNSTLLGSVNTTYDVAGNSSSTYHQPDGTLTASATHMFKPEGGYVDTVRNSDGIVVSVQDVGPGQSSAGVYAPISSYEPSNAVTQEYHSSASTSANYTQDSTQNVVETSSPMATQAAALLYRDAQSAIAHQPASPAPAPAPATVPVQAPARARDTSDVHGIVAANNSNMRSFRTISAILAATAPANAAARPVHAVDAVEHVADPLAIATKRSDAALARDQYDANVETRSQSQNANQVASAPAQELYNTGVSSVLARFKNSADVNSVLIRNQNRENMQSESLRERNTINDASNYQTLNSLLSLGHIQQARLILPIIQQELATQHRSDNTNRMVDAYVQLLKQYSMNDEARLMGNNSATIDR
ncbi:MAG: hypothetical protein JST89_09925 [Cyanobacteria bacterium SZAS-4]|nr:hypothetical protein [Cyanobacteria bacterium SZAS-4]